MNSIFVFIAGALVALYCYKPIVRLINEILGVLYIKRHRIFIFESKYLLINEFIYKLFLIGLKGKVISYTKYSNFIVKNYSYSTYKKYSKFTIHNIIYVLSYYTFIFVLIPLIFVYDYAMYYLAGFALGIAYHFIYYHFIQKNSTYQSAYNVLAFSMAHAYNLTHKSNINIKNDSANNASNPTYITSPESMLKIENTVKKFVKVLSLTLLPISLIYYFGSLLDISSKLSNLYSSISLYAIMLYIILVGLAFSSLVIFYIVDKLKHYRPS